MAMRTGYIYQILSIKSNYSFIGYTSNISSCKYNHKMNVFNGKKGLLYDYIRNNGGWIDFTFRIIDEIHFNNIQELKNSYNNYINTIKPELNENMQTLNVITPLDTTSVECIHNKNTEKCKKCKWNTLCRHGITMKICNICINEKKLCEHNLNKRNCKECNSNKVCIHNKFKYRCYYCKD